MYERLRLIVGLVLSKGFYYFFIRVKFEICVKGIEILKFSHQCMTIENTPTLPLPNGISEIYHFLKMNHSSGNNLALLIVLFNHLITLFMVFVVFLLTIY